MSTLQFHKRWKIIEIFFIAIRKIFKNNVTIIQNFVNITKVISEITSYGSEQ